MNKMKKFLACLLALVMIISLVPMSALAADGYCDVHTDNDSNFVCDVCGGPIKNVCQHDPNCSKITHAYKAPTCREAGQCLTVKCGRGDGYWTLDHSTGDYALMGNYEPDATPIPATGEHADTNGDYVCDVCGGPIKNVCQHDPNCTEIEHQYIAPTCGTAGQCLTVKCGRGDGYWTLDHSTGDYALMGNYESDATPIPATGKHNMVYNNSWSAADKTHQMKCSECGMFRDDPHIDEDKNCKCDVCNADYHPALVSVAQKAATCTEDGYTRDHWYCPVCGKRYKTAAADSPLYDAVIKGGHIKAEEMSKDDTYHWYKCEREGCDEQLEKAKHNMVYNNSWSASDKTHQMKCTECGMFRNDPHIDENKNCECDVCKDGYHANFVFIEKKDATCTEDGYTVSHWYCPDCGKRYMDEAADAPIYDDVVIKGGHIPAEEWSKDDTSHWHKCQREGCDAKLDEDGHGLEYSGQIFYEGEKGSHYMKCPVCEYGIRADHVDGNDDCACDICNGGFHANIAEVAAKDATCEEKGYNAHWHCTDCGGRYHDKYGYDEHEDAVIPATKHNPDTKLSYDEDGHWYACLNEGCNAKVNAADHNMVCQQINYGEKKNHTWRCADNCGYYFEEDHVGIEDCKCDICKFDVHTTEFVEAKAPTCEEEGYNPHWQCVYCKGRFTGEHGTKVAEDAVIPALEHDWDEGEVTTPATCITEGVMTYTCKNDANHTYTKVIPVDEDAHTDVTVTLNVSELYTGDICCSGCNDVLIPGCTLIKVEAKEATCVDKGQIEHLYCEEDGVCYLYENGQHTVVKDVTTPVNEDNHDMDEGEITTPATCVDKGVKTYTCKRGCGHTVTEDVEIDPENHTGETVTKNESETYSGDIHCADCDALLEEGKVIAVPSTPITPAKPTWKNWLDKVINNWKDKIECPEEPTEPEETVPEETEPEETEPEETVPAAPVTPAKPNWGSIIRGCWNWIFR